MARGLRNGRRSLPLLLGVLLGASALALVPALPVRAEFGAWNTTEATTVAGATSGSTLGVAQGANGYPIIVYAIYNQSAPGGTQHSIGAFACTAADCSSGTETVLIPGGDSRKEPRVVVGSSGLPVVFWQHGSDQRVYACSAADCSAGTDHAVSSPPGYRYDDLEVGSGSSITFQHFYATVGSDGLPVAVFKFQAHSNQSGWENGVGFLKCLVADCSSTFVKNLTPVDGQSASPYGNAPALAIGTDGYPIITHGDWTSGGAEGFAVYKCTALDCSTGTNLGTVHTTYQYAQYAVAVAVGSDGLPLLAGGKARAYSGVAGVLYKCTSADCSTGTAVANSDFNNDLVESPDMVVGPDGLPVIVYLETGDSALDLIVYKCSSADCSTGTRHVAANGSSWPFSGPTLGVHPSAYFDGSGNLVVAHRGFNAFSPHPILVTFSTPGEGVTVTASGGSTAVSETGGSDSFTVVLKTQPVSDVVLSVTSADTGEATVAPAQLTFTNGNWDTAQTVTVTGVDDSVDDGTQTTAEPVAVVDGSSADAYDSVADSTVTVTTSDDDTAAFTLSGTAVTVSEAGSTATFTVVLRR